MTNIEKIRAMDSFDLAEFLGTIAECCFSAGRYGTEACEECPLYGACDNDELSEWLESEVEAE